jgi:hypothetical protein
VTRALAFALALVSLPLHAGDVHVWLDDEGRKQISDVVPDRYRARARRVQVPEVAVTAVEAGSAAAGGTAAPVEQRTPEMNCELAWRRYLDSRECLAFHQDALRGLDVDARANCAVVPAPAAQCER